MTIALINQWYFPDTGVGGVAKYNYYITNSYRKLGHKVIMITALDKGKPIYEYRDGIYIYRIRQLKIPPFLMRIPCVNGLIRAIRDFVYSFCVWRKLINLNKKFKIDIVEYADINSEGFFHSLFGPKSVPFVIRCHTPYFVLKDYYTKKELSFASPLIFWMEKCFIKRAPFLTTPSKDLLQLISKELRIPVEKIAVVPNVIDTGKFSPLLTTTGKNDRLMLLFVGRIERAKGVFVLAEAFVRLTETYRHKIRCIFVGQDRYNTAAKLRNFFSGREILNEVEVRGKISEDELIKIYQKCDIFVNPSLIYESFSYTCLEAMACGRPVVASRIGGIPELVKHGETGFLFEVGNEEELAVKVKDLIDNEEKRRRMGEEGRKFVEKYFCGTKIAEKNIEIKKVI